MDEHEHTKNIIKDNNYYKLIEELGFNEDSYYIGENYTAFFCIINKLAISQKLIFTTGSPDEIKLNNASLLGKREERKLDIRFNPISLGKKQFQLYIEPPRRMAKQRLLDKNFFVQERPIIRVEAYIKNPLSPTMTLGKRGEVVFVFKNTGNRPVTGVTIQVQEIQA